MLSETYHWTVEEIANMTPYQQLTYLRGPSRVTFDTLEEAQAAIGGLK